MAEEKTPETSENSTQNAEQIDKTRTQFFILREIIGTLCILILHIFFTVVFLQQVYYTGSFSSLMHFSYETMLVIFILMRNTANDVSENYTDWAVGILGTILPLLLRPAEVPMDIAFLVSF